MLFNSYPFLWVFLPIVCIGFVFCRKLGVSQAMGWLAGCSLFFYGWWNPPYALLLVGSIVFNYSIQRRLSRTASRALLVFGITCNLSLLAYYKYANFFLETFAMAAGGDASTDFRLIDITLPLAISFYTFQQISYLCDAYGGRIIRHRFVDYALFISFFPQLIAGPIVNPREMLPQFRKTNALSPRAEDVAAGIMVFTIGLFKKVVVADTVATFSTPVFAGALAGDSITFIEAWTGALAYTLQLYFDFSGYSDMAVGLGMIFGIRLPINFNSPYKARNIIEFWRRWHITLSRFLRDYLYIPLGGNRVSSPYRRHVNLMIVMLLGGLWHGAGWTFVLWGGLHGAYLIINHGWQKLLDRSDIATIKLRQRRTYRAFAWALTFLAIVFAWVLFRADNLASASSVYAAMIGLNGIDLPANLLAKAGLIGDALIALGIEARPSADFVLWQPISAIWITALLLVVLFCPNSIEWLGRFVRYFEVNRQQLPAVLAWWPPLLPAIIVAALLFYTMVQINNAPSEFLYFQF